MGRKIPIGENASSIHPILSLWLFIAGITATIAIISSLCGSLSRKKSSPPSASQHITRENSRDIFISRPNEAKTNIDTAMESPDAAAIGLEDATDHYTTSPQNEEGKKEEELVAPLPPPPAVLRGAASYHYRSNSTASVGRKLSLRISMSGGRMALRQLSQTEERHDKKREKQLEREDSIWKKKIILGEKCRVPDEDDAIVYDEKGNRISTYHPRTPRSLPVSRQTSSIDPDAIPSLEFQKKW